MPWTALYKRYAVGNVPKVAWGASNSKNKKPTGQWTVVIVYQLNDPMRSLMAGACIFFFSSLSQQASAAADILYDFGVQADNPKVTSTNPALLTHCKPQAMTGFSSRNTEFELQESNSDGGVNVNADKGRNYGSLDFGMCQKLLRWFTYGIHVNANALSFRFETQNQNDPVVFPYGKDTLPLGSGGIGLKVTENLGAGFAWKMVERVDVQARVPVSGLSMQAEIEVEVRPVLSWVLGGTYDLFGQTFYYSYSPEIRGDLDFGMDVDLDLSFVSYDMGLIEMQTAISYVPAMNRAGILGEFAGIQYDIGVVQSQWSKLNDPFLNVDAFGNLDALFFEAHRLQLQDTFEPYIVLKKSLPYDALATFGYSFRRNPIKDLPENEPLVGADMHAVKLGLEKEFRVMQRRIILGGDAIVGFMNGSNSTSSTQSLDGYFTNVQGFIRVPFE